MLYVSGSLAYDRIMTFPGHFEEHILPEKLRILNVCFLIDHIEEKRGGTAGNIAYNLHLLGESPFLLSTLGHDYAAYAEALKKRGLCMDGIRIIKEDYTPVAHITTDQSANQITGFCPGAMRFSCEYNFSALNPEKDMAIVAPGNLKDMKTLPETYRKANVPFIYDPGQQITSISAQDMLDSMRGAAILIANDYEMEMIRQNTGKSMDQLLTMVGAAITTFGEKGCRIDQKDKDPVHISVFPLKNTADPTGAGDSFRAGLLKGLSQGHSLPDAARLGAAIASFCVEKYGTQEHTPTLNDVLQRMEAIHIA